MVSQVYSADFGAGYEALTQGVGIVDFGSRTQIEVTGKDRATFLNNFCTNSVRGLSPGEGCEAFVLNAKGHILGHVFVFAGDQSHVLETVPGQAEGLISHLDRYLIREDVQLIDRSGEWAECLIAGRKVGGLLASLRLPSLSNRLSHTRSSLDGHEIWLRQVDIVGETGMIVACKRDAFSHVTSALIEGGAVYCGQDAFEAARIEHGFPMYGQDITVENLPQEVDRDRWAINFTKGCYLGQETVARIDALGHVNRLLRAVRFAGKEIPPVGSELQSDGKSVGRITSSCWSPKLNSPLTLAYVRREFAQPGTMLASSCGEGTVVTFHQS